MTLDLHQIQKALLELLTSAGPKAVADITIKADGMLGYFRPFGYDIDGPCILEYGDSPLDCINKVRAKWDEMSDRVRSETVKKIALAVIRITYEQGVCTDAALRAEFAPADIKKYRGEALKLANTMAENGPFEIVELQGANAA